MDFGTGIRFAADGDVFEDLRCQGSCCLEGFSQQLGKVTDVFALLVFLHAGFFSQTLANQIARGAFADSSEGLSVKTEVQQKPKLKAGI
ncbi:hypothetical protein D3C81_2005220 [compost metagenome]